MLSQQDNKASELVRKVAIVHAQKGICRGKNVDCPSTQTSPSVWKLESWNFAYRLLMLVPKKLPTRFLNFVHALIYWRFSSGLPRRRMLVSAEIWRRFWLNLIMTFPIKKRITTELFIDGKNELYIHKRWIMSSWLDLLERVKEIWLGRQKTWEWKAITAGCSKWRTKGLWMRTYDIAAYLKWL